MRYILYSFFVFSSLILFVSAAQAQFDTTYVERAKDTSSIAVFDITNPGTATVNFQADPSNGNNAHRIDFQNTTPVSIVFKSASLTGSSGRFDKGGGGGGGVHPTSSLQSGNFKKDDNDRREETTITMTLNNSDSA